MLEGWTPRKPRNKAHRIAFTYSNDTQTALLFFRKNGIDLYIEDGTEADKVRPHSVISFPASAVRHHLPYSEVNLMEHVLGFAEAFAANANDYAGWTTPIGSHHPRPAREQSLYEALGGDGTSRIIRPTTWLSAR